MKRALLIGAGALAGLLALAAAPLLFAPAPHPRAPAAFAGPRLCNPYESISPGSRWLMANFHAHSDAWEGKQPACQVIDAYRKKGYEVTAVSDHETLTDTSGCGPGTIPSYEHGANLSFAHFTALGARERLFDLYPLGLSLAAKQHTIDRLAAAGDYVVVNHPCHAHAFSESDMASLSGYQAVEVDGLYCGSTRFWDAALGAGYPAYCFTGDDSHDAMSAATGSTFLLVAAPSATEADVLASLRSGAFVCGRRLGDGPAPYPLSLKVEDGLLSVHLSSKARSLRFIGPGGALLREDRDVDSASFPMGDGPYVRIEAESAAARVWMQAVHRCGP